MGLSMARLVFLINAINETMAMRSMERYDRAEV